MAEHSEDIVPVDIQRDGASAISIMWSDGGATRWSVHELRKICPCATCREKRKATSDEQSKPKVLPILSAAEARPLSIESMSPVGSYAYNIGFSDGHSSGIFTFDLLRSKEN